MAWRRAMPCHLVYRHALDVHNDTATIAMASTTSGMWIRSDAAEHWQRLTPELLSVSALRLLA